MKTTESSSNPDLQSWILDFLSKPNKVFDNLPPCPFAKKAWLDGNVEVKKFEGFDSLDKDVANWDIEMVKRRLASIEAMKNPSDFQIMQIKALKARLANEKK